MTQHRPSLSAIAKHFGISRTAARDLEIQNIINRANGIDACRIAYINHLRCRPRFDGAADSRLREARAAELEVRTAERLGRLVGIDEYEAMVDGLCGLFLSELSALPGRFTRDLTQRKALEQEAVRVRERVAAAARANAAALSTR